MWLSVKAGLVVISSVQLYNPIVPDRRTEKDKSITKNFEVGSFQFLGHLSLLLSTLSGRARLQCMVAADGVVRG